MAIRLDNFEQTVEPIIVQRGKTYFRSGRVTKCTDENGEVEAVVQGSERYKVSMFVDADGELHEHRCTCPYDWGSICKHEVAVLYYLRESRKSKDASEHSDKSRKPEVTDIVEDIPSNAQTNGTSDSKLTNKEAGHRLSDELFTKLPPEEFDKHILALCLIHDGLIDKGHLTRIAKSSQLTISEASERMNFVYRRHWIEIVDYRNIYRLRSECVLATAMYVLDRHPEWLTAELMNVRQTPSHILNFWHACTALYEGDIDFLKRQRISSTYINQNAACWQVAFLLPYYFPLAYALDDSLFFRSATDALRSLEYGELLSEKNLHRLQQVSQEREQEANASIYAPFHDYLAAMQYMAGGALPMPQKQPTEWFYIAHAVSAVRQEDMKKAAKLWESALKIHNRESRVKNLFFDPIACYYLMVYYAKLGGEEAKKKALQYLKKDVSKSVEQFPAMIVARYVILGEDDGNLSWYIGMLQASYPLLQAFARLLADYFKIDIDECVPHTRLTILDNDPLLFSIHIKPQWEKALEDLMVAQESEQETIKAKPKKQERLVYVIQQGWGDKPYICPQKQKACKDGSWSKPYNVSAQTYFTTGYDFMDEVDRPLYDHLRKTVNHTKYYYHPNWGILSDYLPYLVDTDKVLLKRDENDYAPVSVREERAYLSIEHKGKSLVFGSNVQFGKNDFAIPSPCIVEENETSYVVIELTPYERKVFETLLRLGTMPEEAESKLKQFISTISNDVEIHSDMIEGGSTLEKVQGDLTLVFRVAPRHGEFSVECCVQPLANGRLRFYPGEGKAIIFDEREGTRYQVERNLTEETRRLDTFNEFAAAQLGCWFANEPQTVDIEDVLALMELVAKDAHRYAIEWLDGAKIDIKQPVNVESYSMGLRTKENWFEVEGDLQIDEQTILSAAELLKMMQGKMIGKRFVRLGESEFLALSEKLAKQLKRVQQLAHINKNKVIIPRYEVGLLGEILSRPDSILREDQGVSELLQKIDEAAHMPIELPKNLQATLRDYQEEGYRWMMRLAAWGTGACLADDMGLGKTVQTIAVLLTRANQGPSLVVAPASVVFNWQNEIERFAPTLKAHILNESGNRKKLIQSLRAHEVLLTTYGLLVREEKALTDKTWNVVCLDEAHTIKNRQTKMSQAAMCLHADFRIALTGTPLQNYLSELWNLFQFINPSLLGSYETFNHDFITPIEAEHDKRRQQTLRQILQPFLLRRTKAEVIDELPEKTEIIRRVELSDEERVAYEAMRIEAQQQVEQASKVDMNVLASITRLRQAACSLELVQNGSSMSANGGSKLDDCVELLTQITTGGNRVLVFSQFTSFLTMAQNSLNSHSVNDLASHSEAVSHPTGEAGITSFYLDGSTPLAKRKQMVERFQNGEAQVFFISLKAGGLGLNLTGANYVIHLDPWWNPAIEQQATDRAYRIGQKRNVTVYHLIAADTIEEKILRLHKTKRDLADALLQDQNTAQSITLDDLKMLLEEK